MLPKTWDCKSSQLSEVLVNDLKLFSSCPLSGRLSLQSRFVDSQLTRNSLRTGTYGLIIFVSSIPNRDWALDKRLIYCIKE